MSAKIKKNVPKHAKTSPKKSVKSPSKTKAKPKPAPKIAGKKVSPKSEVKSTPASKPEIKAPIIKPLPVKQTTIVSTPTVPSVKPPRPPPKPKPPKSDLDDIPLDYDEKEDLEAQEKDDLELALSESDDEVAETTFVPTDTSERYILVVDEEGKRRTETVLIISQILPNAIIEIADDPEEAQELMIDCEFDTYVVNFLMPGYSASLFVKAVANHPDHPLLIGFAADKISDAVDPKKGLKIIPLKRLFDLDISSLAESADGHENGRGGKD